MTPPAPPTGTSRDSSSSIRKMRLRLALIVLVFVAPGPPAAACDSSSCTLLTRGENGLIPRKKLRLDVSLGYTDLGRLQRGSQEVDGVFRPRVFLERREIFPGFHRDIDGSDRAVQMDLTYGLATRFNLTASVPLALWPAHEVAHGTLQHQYTTTGLGHVLLGPRAPLGPRGLVGG